MSYICLLLLKITISSIMSGVKKTLLIHLPSCYRTIYHRKVRYQKVNYRKVRHRKLRHLKVRYRKVRYRKVQNANHIQSCRLN